MYGVGCWRWICSDAVRDALIFHIMNSIVNRVIATRIKLSIIVMRWKYTKPHTQCLSLYTLCSSPKYMCEWSFLPYSRHFSWIGFSQPFTTIWYIANERHSISSSANIVTVYGPYNFDLNFLLLVCCRFAHNNSSIIQSQKRLIHTVSSYLIVPKFRFEWTNSGWRHHTIRCFIPFDIYFIIKKRCSWAGFYVFRIIIRLIHMYQYVWYVFMYKHNLKR